MQLGEALRRSLGLALSDLWLQPEVLVFQHSGTGLCKELIRHRSNCIIYRQNGNMLSDVTKQSSELLEKGCENSSIPGKARVGCSPVASGSYSIAKPTLSATEWVQCSFPDVTGRVMLFSLGRSDDIV